MRRFLYFLVLLLVAARPGFGAIARDGDCTSGTTSCTLTATATGDLQIFFAYRNANVTPTLPGTLTQIGTFSGSDGDSFIAGCKVASSSGDTGSGTFTNATHTIGVSYSGTAAGTTGNCNTTGIGGTCITHATASTSISYCGFTLTNTNNTSWVVGIGGDTTLSPCVPTGMTSVSTEGSGIDITLSDTNGTVSSWSTTSCTVTGSTWVSWTGEVLVSGTVVPSGFPVIY